MYILTDFYNAKRLCKDYYYKYIEETDEIVIVRKYL